MTEAGLLEVVEVDEALEFDVPCDFPKGCDQAAVWSGVPDCCSVPTLRCDEHRRQLEALFAVASVFVDAVGVMHHGGCGRMARWMRWEPLKGGGGRG